MHTIVHYFVHIAYNKISNMFLFPDFYKGVHMFKRHENSFINSWNADDSLSRAQLKYFKGPEWNSDVAIKDKKAKIFFLFIQLVTSNEKQVTNRLPSKNVHNSATRICENFYAEIVF